MHSLRTEKKTWQKNNESGKHVAQMKSKQNIVTGAFTRRRLQQYLQNDTSCVDNYEFALVFLYSWMYHLTGFGILSVVLK